MSFTTGSYGQTPDGFNPGADLTVYALAVQPDGGIVVGGGFSSLGGQTRYRLGRLDAEGVLDPLFNPGSEGGTVTGVAIQPDGRILVAGLFSALGGQSCQNLGRLNADGTLDTSFVASADRSVSCLALQPDGKILVGGGFRNVGGQVRMSIARLNANGSVDPDFDPGADQGVNTLALQPDGLILAGGRFTTLGNGGGSYLARLDPAGAADTSFYPQPNDYVYSLAVQPNGNIVVAGRFTWLGGQPCNGIGRLDAAGVLETGFGAGADGAVYTVALQADGKILVGGAFTSLAGQPCNRIGRLNADGSLDTAFRPGASGTVYSLALQRDGTVLAGGSFATLGESPRSNLGRLTNPDPVTDTLDLDSTTVTWRRGGSSPEVWRTRFAVTTNGMNWADLGEGAPAAGGWELSGLALPAQATVRARGWVTGGQYNGSVWHVEAAAGFPRITRQPVSRTNDAGTTALFSVEVIGSPASYRWWKDGAPLSNAGGISGSAAPTLVLTNVLGGDGGGYSLVVSNSHGSITSAVARLTVIDPIITSQPTGLLANGGRPAALQVAATGTALQFQWRRNGSNLPAATAATLAFPNVQWSDRGSYDVIVSNRFGCLTSAVAQVTVNLAAPDPFPFSPDGKVTAVVEQPDGSILLGGRYNPPSEPARDCLRRFRVDTTLDVAFNPGVGGVGVFALGLRPNSAILVAGEFSKVGGQLRNNLACLKGDGMLDSAFDFGLNDSEYVFSLVAQPAGKTLIGGSYLLAQVGADGLREAGFHPIISGHIYSVAWQTNGQIVVGGYLSGLNSLQVTNLGRLNADGSTDTNFTAVADGYVRALAVQADGKILVGGDFTVLCGQPRDYLGRLNADGSLDLAFNPVLDGVGPSLSSPWGPLPFVSCILLQADGRIIVGGLFTNLCGEARSCIGRLNPDGSIDPTFNPWVEGWDATARALALQADGRVLVGGQFVSLAGSAATNFGRLLNPDTATQALALHGSTITWLRGGASPEAYGTTFDYSSDGSNWVSLGTGTRIVGGWQLTGVSVPSNATLRARGFVAGGEGNGSSWYVETTLGKPVINTQPASRTNLATTPASFSVNASGANPITYQWLKNGLELQDGGNLSGTHTATLVVSNTLHADAGSYSVVVSNSSGVVTSRVATLTVVDPVITGQPVSQAVGPGSNAMFTVTALGTDPHYQWRRNGENVPGATTPSLSFTDVQGADAGVYDVVVSNAFGVLYSATAMLTVNTVTLDTFNPDPTAQVLSLAVQADGKVVIGGEFTALGASVRYYLGRLTTAGMIDNLNLDASARGYTKALAIQPDNFVLVGGYRLGRYQPDGSLDPNFSFVAENWLHSFTAFPDGRFLVASDPEGLRRFDSDGTLDGAFHPALPGIPKCAALLPDGSLLVGPAFGSFKALLRLHADGSLDPDFNLPLGGLNTAVVALALLPEGKILVGGSFNTLGGQPRTNLARLNPDGSLDSAFLADADACGADAYVSALAVQADGLILVAGGFSRLAGELRSKLGRLQPDGRLDPTFNPGANGNVYALALQPDGNILVGGSFTWLGGSARRHLGRLINNRPATQFLHVDGAGVTWVREGAAPDLGSTTLAISSDGSTWTELGPGVRVPGGWRFSPVPVTVNSFVRARGYVTGAQWFVEQTSQVGPATPPILIPGAGAGTNRWSIDVRALPGQTVVVEGATGFTNWVAIQTNVVSGTGGFPLIDSNAQALPRRFYRARLEP